MAPLQPQEVTDASARIAFLALTNPKDRPIQFSYGGTSHRNNRNRTITALSQSHANTAADEAKSAFISNNPYLTLSTECSSNTITTSSIVPPVDTFMYYDAVGPETMTILEMLGIFAKAQGNDSFRPVFIEYRNMEKLLNVRSLGNLNRQFVSLLRSEQDSDKPIIGDPTVWESLLLGPNTNTTTTNITANTMSSTEEEIEKAKLQRLQHALLQLNQDKLQSNRKRRFPYLSVFDLVYRYPKVIVPGVKLSMEILDTYIKDTLLDTLQ